MDTDPRLLVSCLASGHPIQTDGFCPCGQEYDMNQDQTLDDRAYYPEEEE